ncbi:MAG: hypothetical protein MJZ72_05440 [Bacteroidales bacterium]|nr:hypothetical protein [Bacteroidales bacterium]
MNDNKFLKIFSLVAFTAFAAVSCWSTTESLSLTLEHAEIPKWVFWIAVVGLYVLTSICVMLVINSFNQNIYMEHRRVKFVIGLLGVLLLWIFFSMPTNAHTYFYKQMAKNTAIKELKHIDGELQKLSSENVFLETYNAEWNKYEADVLNALAGIKREINDFQNPGTAEKTEARIVDTEDLLGLKTGTIARIKARNNTQKELNKVCEYYDKAVKEQLDIKKQQHEAKVSQALEDFQEKMKNVAPLRHDIKATLEQLDDDQYDKESVLKNARKVIGVAYAELESQFNGIYTYDEKVYRSDRLVKVTKVWGDYFKGKFKGTDYTLWYWILLSIIVDIAAFAFFDIAFKKEE